MVNKADTNKARLRRHKRVRGKIAGTAERPRLNVFRSSTNIYAQIIDDTAGRTLCAASSLDKSFEGKGGNKEAARKVGKMLAEKAAEKGITNGIQIIHSDNHNPCSLGQFTVGTLGAGFQSRYFYPHVHRPLGTVDDKNPVTLHFQYPYD